ncbi:M24 family metallopeptidase [Kiritimatiella glycovorans]|nr:M24 family metallopeptidase [Kiritimatiella glycovorans]
MVRRAADGHVVVPEMERNRVEAAVGGSLRVWTPEELGVRKGGRRDRTEWCRRLLRRLDIGRVVTTPDTAAGIVRALVRAGFRVDLSERAAACERACKTEAELRGLRESQRAAADAMRRAAFIIADSAIDRSGRLVHEKRMLTPARLRRAIRTVLLDHDCLAPEVIAAGGAESADPHHPGEAEYRAGTPIVVDIFPRHAGHGYCGDLTRTFCRGPAPRALRDMVRAVRAAQREALSMVCPGVRGDEVHRRVCALFRERGYVTDVRSRPPSGFIHGTGHGVGLEIHEAPRIAPGGGVLEEGHVVTIEPGLYYPGTGGVRIEDTVEITRDGNRLLAPCSRRWEFR